MVGNSAYDWKTMPTPRSRGGTSLTHRPSKTTSPASGRSKPTIIRTVVVLPHPDPPTTDTSSPGATSSDNPSTAVAAPNLLVTPRNEIFILFERGLRPRNPVLGGGSEERASRERRASEGGQSPPPSSSRKLLQPLLDQAVLVLGRLDEVEVDQVHVRDLLAGNRDVGPGDAGPAP